MKNQNHNTTPGEIRAATLASLALCFISAAVASPAKEAAIAAAFAASLAPAAVAIFRARHNNNH